MKKMFSILSVGLLMFSSSFANEIIIKEEIETAPARDCYVWAFLMTYQELEGLSKCEAEGIVEEAMAFYLDTCLNSHLIDPVEVPISQ